VIGWHGESWQIWRRMKCFPVLSSVRPVAAQSVSSNALRVVNGDVLKRTTGGLSGRMSNSAPPGGLDPWESVNPPWPPATPVVIWRESSLRDGGGRTAGATSFEVRIEEAEAVGGKPRELDFETRWSTLVSLCGERSVESKGEERAQEELRELLHLATTLPKVLLTRSRVKEVVELMKVSLRVGTSCTRPPLGKIVGALSKVPTFWGEVEFGLIARVLDNVPGADALERRETKWFLVEWVARQPEQRERVQVHLLEQLQEAAWSTDPAGARALLELLWELVTDSSSPVVKALVIPLLGSPGLSAFGDIFGRWLQLLAADPEFREALLDRLIRGFPVSSRESALVFLWLLGGAVLGKGAVAVPERLGRRLLSVLAECLRRPYDEEVNKSALGVLRSSRVGELVSSVEAEEVVRLVEALLRGASEEGSGSRSSCRDALGFVCARRPRLLREFIGRFRDRESAARKRWAAIAERAERAGHAAAHENFSTSSLVSEPAVARPTACPGRSCSD
jgi:hypothetical protein